VTARRRAGYTLIELALTITIVGTLAAVSVPKLGDVKRRAVATQVLSDVEAVRTAAFSFFSDSGYFPPPAGSGAIPTNMGQYLPLGFTFTRPAWTLSYEAWPFGWSFRRAATLVGVAVTTNDPRVAATASAMMRDHPQVTSGSKITFLVVGL
jgi:prepilin-type N-terminal cleavage/methylation domain-containing protein